MPVNASPASDRRPPSSYFLLFTFLGPSSALHQINDHNDDGNYDQEMNETAANVTEEAEKPEHEQDNNYCPEHGVPFDLTKLAAIAPQRRDPIKQKNRHRLPAPTSKLPTPISHLLS